MTARDHLFEESSQAHWDQEQPTLELVDARGWPESPCLEALATAISTGLFVFERVEGQLRLGYANAAGLALCSTPEFRPGRSTMDQLFPGSEDLEARLMMTLERSPSGQVDEYRHADADGSRAWRVRAFPLSQRHLGVAFDELQLGGRAELRPRDELPMEAHESQLSSFVRVANLALQEPLRELMVYSGQLGADSHDTLDQRGQGFLEQLVSAGQRLSHLLHGLAEYSEAVAVPRPFEPVELEELLSDVIADLGASIGAAGAEIELLGLPLAVHGDRQSLRQLFHHLLHNSVKYRRDLAETFVSVRGEVIERDGTEWVRIVVRDNGVGFASDDAERIFGLFERLDQTSDLPGLGVGLAVARRIARAHGGDLRAKGAPGVGARMTVELPCAQYGNSAVRRLPRGRHA
tara:strand:+ start:1744 stop:2961 length:1218 start_codon:yes stop_codon:yes gene_type:complete